MKKPSKYWILAGTFFTSISSIIIRFSEAPALIISAYRMLFTSLMLLLPVILKSRNDLKNLNKNNFTLCMISGVFLAFHYAAWISSIQMTTIANSTILVSCSPIFVAGANHFIFREKFNKKMILGIIMSFIGTIIIAMGSSKEAKTGIIAGNILAFSGAVFVAVYLVIGGIARKNLSALLYVFIVYSVSAIVLFSMCVFSDIPIYPYPAKELLLFFLLGFFSSILGHTVYNYLVKYHSSTLISISTLGEPIFASMLAIPFLHEIPSMYSVTGGIIIISGIYYYLSHSEK